MSVQDPSFVYFEDDLPSRSIVKVLLTRMMKFKHLIMFEESTNVIAKVETLDPKPTIFFIDIQMKPHDGYEILRQLRADARFDHATLIAMTANVMSHDVDELKKAGFDGLIGKPIIQENFPQLIERIIAGQPVWFIP